MNKKIALVAIMIIVLTLSISITSTVNAATKHTVTYNIYNGKQIKKVTVNHNQTLTKPQNPTREGHTFLGWYKDANYVTKYNFANKVTSNMTLYAKWAINKYTVTFNTDGGSIINPVTVTYNNMVPKPVDPVKSNMIFAGWYKDADFEQKFSFLTKVKSNTTLYANWVDKNDTTKTYDVTFVTLDRIDPFIIEVESGKSVDEIVVPTGEGEYTYAEWYKNKEKTELFDLTTPITTDLVLYGKLFNNEGMELIDVPDTGVSPNLIIYTVGVLLIIFSGFAVYKYLKKAK